MGRPVVFSPPPPPSFFKNKNSLLTIERLDQDYRSTSEFTHDFRLIRALLNMTRPITLTSTVKKSLEVNGGTVYPGKVVNRVFSKAKPLHVDFT